MNRFNRDKWFLARTAKGVSLRAEVDDTPAEHVPIFWDNSYEFTHEEQVVHKKQYPIGETAPGTHAVYIEDQQCEKHIIAIDIDDFATASILAHARLRFNTRHNNPEGIGIILPDATEVIIA